MAPEAQKGRYSTASDMWSAGVILFVMFAGYFPASCKCTEKLPCLSEEIRGLINGLLVKDPQHRTSAKQVLQHRWLVGSASTTRSKQHSSDFRKAMQSLDEFYRCNKLQRAALTTLASQLSSQEMDAFREQFQRIDTDCNGVITKDELIEALEVDPPVGVDFLHAWVDMIFGELDSDNSGSLDFTEYTAALLTAFPGASEEVVRAAFRIMDTNDDGTISLEELERVLNMTHEELLCTMVGADLNGDGVIDFEEFQTMLSSTNCFCTSNPLAAVAA